MSSVSAVLTNPSVERVRQALERAEIFFFRAARSDSSVLVMSSGARHPHSVFRLTYPDLLSITGGTEAFLSG